MSDQDPDFNEDAAYDTFPEGASDGNGPVQGFNTWMRINEASLFTQKALDDNPALRAFVDAPIVVTYAQFKSSHRESEYFIHKPVEAMTDKVEGIGGIVDGLANDPRIATLVINHERTLARHITRALVITDAPGSTGAGGTAGQILHKEPEPAP